MSALGIDDDIRLFGSFTTDMRLTNLSPVTIADRVEVLARMTKVLGRPLLQLEADDLRHYQAERFANLAPASVNIYTRHIQAFYRWAVRRGLLEADPAAGLIVPKISRGRPHPTSPEDLKRIFACTHGDLRMAYVLAAFAGVRRGGICRLERPDLDLTPGAETALVHGKGGRDYTVPLVPAVVRELNDYGLPRRGYVVTRRGRPYQVEQLSLDSTTHLRQLGIETTLHSLRHYFLTNAARLTRDPLFVRDIAGHSSVVTTEIYMETNLWGAHAKLAGMADLSSRVLAGGGDDVQQLAIA